MVPLKSLAPHEEHILKIITALIHVVCTQWDCLSEAIPMVVHTICFGVLHLNNYFNP